MSSILRSLRPLRTEIKKLLKEKPIVTRTFDSSEAQDTYIYDTQVFVNTLKARRSVFFQLHDKLLSVSGLAEADQKSVDDVVEGDSTLLLEIDECIEQYSLLLQRLSHATVHTPASLPTATAPAPRVKLPKIDLRKFAGEVTQWQEFWDSFESSIHNNATLSTVDKFNYLKGVLVGEAKNAITGLALTNENYQQAIAILQQRFGDKQLIVNSHYAAMANLQPASDQTSKIREVVDTLEKHLRSLKAMDQDVEHGQFIAMFLAKLPRDFIMRIEESRGDTPWTVANLRKKIQLLLAAREMAEQHYKPTPSPGSGQIINKQLHPKDFSKKSNIHHNTTDALLATAEGKRPTQKCLFCHGAHWSDECKSFVTTEARKKQVRGKCFICLRDGHNYKACQADKACYHCKQKKNHHRSLCPKKFPTKNTKKENACTVVETPPGDLTSFSQPTVGAESALVNVDDRGLLQTAIASIENPENGHSAFGRLVFDCGSQRTYITKDLAQKLHAKPQFKETLTVFTFGSSEPKLIETKVNKLRLKLLDGSHFEFLAHTVPKIGQIHHPPASNFKLGVLYKTLPLADSNDKEPQTKSIDLLIGNNYYWDLVTSERIELAKGLYLIGSKLGWMLSGRMNDASFWEDKPSTMLLTSVSDTLADQLPYVEADQPLLHDIQLEEWWNLESMGIKDSPQDSDDEIALEKFNTTIQYKDQRYYVTWPWKDNVDNLPTNYALALGRLNSLIRRFRSDPKLLETYDEIIQMQLKKGIIEMVHSNDSPNTKKHYIPHHPVITPDKTTTKVRIVYDGSAKTSKANPSINECLYRGPVILDDVGALLIRFRFHKVGLTADIEKAFLQVGLQPSTRDVTRFLWLKDLKRLTTNENIQIYRFTRVPFGIISSPFLLGATIAHHLKKDGSELGLQILKDIYVDNVITGASSTDQAIKFYSAAKALFHSASMNLREWASNDITVMKTIPADDCMPKKTTKVLGMIWNTVTDELCLARAMPKWEAKLLSKRTILQSIAKVFDPLGIYSPALVRPKLFLQSLWLVKQQWDDLLDPPATEQWFQLMLDVDQITSLTVPRYVGPILQSHHPCTVELHCFTDASKKAYGACVYVRFSSASGTSASLLFAKSRLAPTRPITLPRLELLAVDIGGRILQFVENALNINIDVRHLWTDSQCVLHWIRNKKPLSTFVSNRIDKLRKLAMMQYHYVSTDQNPADLVSRGCTVDDLRTSKLWWNGPSWLSLDPTEWPYVSDQFEFDSDTLHQIASEQRPQTLFEASMIAATASDDTVVRGPFGIDSTHFSNLTKLLRVTAWCLRFWNRSKVKKSNASVDRSSIPKSLLASEIKAAKQLWVKHVQRKCFSDVFETIEKGKRVLIQEQLGLWLDEHGILRCKGRLVNANMDEGAKFPILLPKQDWFTTLIIRAYHEQLFHSGTAHTLSQIRQEFWIPGGRATVHKYIMSCLRCKQFEGGPYKPPQMPALPKSRVNVSTPFTWTGLDYLGPLYLKRGNGTTKVWICLFTCMTTRAVHLELIEDLTAEQFMLCLRRFIGRRGTPSHIISDNAKQFKLAKSATDQMWKKVVMDENLLSYVSRMAINWTFIPERAPWMGGFYERLIQLVKRALRKSIQNLCLTLIQLQTLLTEVEAMLNSRPLVYIGADFNDGKALTPAHFLTLNPKIGIPSVEVPDKFDPEYVENLTSKTNLLQSWTKGEKHLQAFWKVWKNEYLLSLRERTQTSLKYPKCTVVQQPKLGDVVHIRAESSRGTWPLGRIVELVRSADGEIRTAKVRLASGHIWTRAILHLYPLEVQNDPGQEKEIPPFDHLVNPVEPEIPGNLEVASRTIRPQRKAAKAALSKIRSMTLDEDIDTGYFASTARRSTKFLPNTNAVFIVLCLLMMLFQPGAFLQPLICEKGSAKLAIDLSDSQTCHFNVSQKVDQVFQATVAVYKSNIAKYASDAYKCYKVTTVVDAWTNFAKAGFDHRKREEVVPISESECRTMVRDRRCPEGPLLGGDDLAFTENHVEPPYSTGNAWDCCKWIQAKTTNCFITKGKVYQTFNGHMESNLGNVIDCSYDKDSCILHDQSALIWSINKNATCKYILWRTVEGKLWNKQLLTNDLTIALTWHQTEETVQLCDGSTAMLTDQGVPIKIIDQSAPSRVIQAPTQRTQSQSRITSPKQPPNKRETDQSDLTALRLQALEIRLESLFHESLNQAFYSVCHAIKELQEMDEVLAHSEPTLIARKLLNDSKIMGRLYGPILEVWPCSPVDSYMFLGMGNKCSEWIPLNFTNRGVSSFGYMDPKTLIIYANSAPSECDLVQEIYLQVEGHGLMVYKSKLGNIQPFEGRLLKHPLHMAKVIGYNDFQMVIHKPIQMYTQNELRAQSSLNDIFAAIDHHAKILEELSQVVDDPIKSPQTKRIMDTINRYTPWGLLSSWANKALWIWIYACCIYVSLQFIWNLLIPKGFKGITKRATSKMFEYVPYPFKKQSTISKSTAIAQVIMAMAQDAEDGHY